MTTPRRPYIESSDSTGGSARFWKEGGTKESVFEKPYLEESYREMHLKPSMGISYSNEFGQEQTNLPYRMYGGGGMFGGPWRMPRKISTASLLAPCADAGGIIKGVLGYKNTTQWMSNKSWNVKTSDPDAVVLIENPWSSRTPVQIVTDTEGSLYVEINLGDKFAVFSGGVVRPPKYKLFPIRGRTADQLRRNAMVAVGGGSTYLLWTPCNFIAGNTYWEDFSPKQTWTELATPYLTINGEVVLGTIVNENTGGIILSQLSTTLPVPFTLSTGICTIQCSATATISNDDGFTSSLAAIIFTGELDNLTLSFAQTFAYYTLIGAGSLSIDLSSYGFTSTTITAVDLIIWTTSNVDTTATASLSIDYIDFA